MLSLAHFLLSTRVGRFLSSRVEGHAGFLWSTCLPGRQRHPPAPYTAALVHIDRTCHKTQPPDSGCPSATPIPSNATRKLLLVFTPNNTNVNRRSTQGNRCWRSAAAGARVGSRCSQNNSLRNSYSISTGLSHAPSLCSKRFRRHRAADLDAAQKKTKRKKS